MTDPLDLDAIETRTMTGVDLDKWWLISNVMALVAELRTARAERDAAQMKYEMTDGALSVMQARIDEVRAVCDEQERVHNFSRSIRAALSGATEPAEETR